MTGQNPHQVGIVAWGDIHFFYVRQVAPAMGTVAMTTAENHAVPIKKRNVNKKN